MVYVKSLLTGLAALLVVLFIGLGSILMRAIMSSPAGVGVVVGGGLPVLAFSLVAFVAGCLWQYRRLRS